MVDYLKIKQIYLEELNHSGVIGQRKGHRRYQYEDGSLTPLGRQHYGVGPARSERQKMKSVDRPETNKEDDTTNTTSKATQESVKSNSKKQVEFDPSKTYIWTDKQGRQRVYKSEFATLDDKQVAALQKRMENESKIASQYKDPERPTAKDLIDQSANLLNATSRALPTGNGKYVKKDYSALSDQELRQRISRLQLEESYGKLTGETKYVKSGSEKAREYLQTAGAVLGVAGSAAALAIQIYKMKHADHGEIDPNDPNALSHYGIQGQKKGVRRFQYPNGTLTPEGKERYRQDTGTKEIMKNTSKYSNLIKRKQIKEYEKYGERVGAKKGFFAGMGIGALAGITKQTLQSTKKYENTGSLLDDGDDGTELINKFIGKALLGAMAGAGIGTLAGAKMGKKNAQAKLAEHGKQYVDDLLDIPVDRLHIRKY